MWEVSTSLSRGGQPYPVGALVPGMGRLLVEAAMNLVDGVGNERHWHTDSVSVHIRATLTEAEMAKLPPEWLACPAIDNGGRGEAMSLYPPW